MIDLGRLPAMAPLVFVVASVATAAAQSPVGSELLVNVYTTGNQSVPAIAADANGNYVVAWNSVGQDGSAYGVVARRFDLSGTLIGSEFVVNSYTTGDQMRPTVAGGRNGSFIVVWQGRGAQGSSEVYARRFDRTGSTIGSEFLANTYTTSFQGFPAAAVDGSGQTVIAWRDAGLIVSARRFATDGSALGPEFIVHEAQSLVESGPGIATNAAGDFVIVWAERSTGIYTDVRAQRFDASGNRVGGDFVVHEASTTSSRRADPVVSLAPNGAFTVAWGQGSPSDVFARRFGQHGNPIGDSFLVNTYTTSDDVTPAIAPTAEQGFVVTWTAVSPFGVSEVLGQRFDASGRPFGNEFRVNTQTAGFQISSPRAVASDRAGNFVVTWWGPDGSSYGIYAQPFGGFRPAAMTVDDPPAIPPNDANGVLEPGERAEVRTGWQTFRGPAGLLYGKATRFDIPGGSGQLDHALATYDFSSLNPAMCASNLPLGCFRASVTAPTLRPAAHWDAVLHETWPSPHLLSHDWTVHVGDSFRDVPRTSSFYRFVETLLHHGITAGCTATAYCPAASTSREQVAVFVLIAAAGSGYAPPACGTPMFPDVPASSPFCPWIEELARRGVVGGCGSGSYCPAAPVSREQMAVFALRSREPALTPPPCGTPMFADVPASSGFCPWIEELARRGVVSGCGGGNYCPGAPVTREQMAVFVVATFGLQLYGP